MKKEVLFSIIFMGLLINSFAQIAINSNGVLASPKAMLDVNSTEKGILIPCMTQVQRDAITNPANGLLVFVTNNNSFNYYDSIAGTWFEIKSSLSSFSISDSDGDTYITTQEQNDSDTINIYIDNTLKWRFTGSTLEALNNGEGVLVGEKAGVHLTNNSVHKNNFIGYEAGFHCTNDGVSNTALGHSALYSNTFGDHNAAIGVNALYNNTTGSKNIAAGNNALYNNTVGESNIAIGIEAMKNNTVGARNIAIGKYAMFQNSKSSKNIAIGNYTMYNMSFSSETAPFNAFNIAIGDSALMSPDNVSTGINNIGIGHNALLNIKTGQGNTSTGQKTLQENLDGNYNTAIGFEALKDNVNGNFNTVLGNYTTLSSGNLINTTAIGYATSITADNTIRFGNSSVTSIGGEVDWSSPSTSQFQTSVNDGVKGLEFILGLRPVSYNVDFNKLDEFTGREYRLDETRPNSIGREYGFIAQEVEDLANKLGFRFSGVDTPTNDNSYYGLRYALFVVPLVKAMQEQQQQIKNNVSILAEQQKSIEQLITKLNNIKYKTNQR
jgi:hypothetical protein